MTPAEKLLKSRESQVQAGGYTFTIRRPTLGDVVRLGSQLGGGLEIARRFTVGWDLREVDLLPGGGPEPMPFEAELWAAWLDDHEEVWAPLAEAIGDAWQAHQQAKERAAKN